MFLSLRWKLALTLISVTAGVALTYVYIAKTTFETDKISYVFAFQQTHLESTTAGIEGIFERVVWDSRALTASFDVNRNQLNEIGMELFRNHPYIQAVRLWNPDEDKDVFLLQKRPSRLPASAADRETANFQVRSMSHDEYDFTTTLPSDTGRKLILRIQAKLPELLPDNPTGGDFFLFEDGRLIAGTNNLPGVEVLPKHFGSMREPATAIRKVGKEDYLVSLRPVAFSKLSLVELIPAAEALKSVKVLYRRSVAFLVLSGFAVAILALLLSNRLTGSLALLSSTAEQIGKGNFNTEDVVSSNDEVGVLSSAFKRMGVEIQRLVRETGEKSRMEAELQTARIVQESLLPEQKTQTMGTLSWSGVWVSSTECSGDWWHAFARGEDLYIIVADATGHGTPSALITSATRSIFSFIEVVNLDMGQMAHLWDRAVNACSKGKVHMTGCILRINMRTGEGELMSASHEPPLRWLRSGGHYKVDSVECTQTQILGKNEVSERPTTRFQVKPGEFILICTDGLFSMRDEKNEEISEGKILRIVTKILNERTHTPESSLQAIMAKLDEARGSHPLPDDVTAVMLTRTPEAKSTPEEERAPG